ncbi:MAG TPA: hypothetical protein VHS32_25610, partial [Streptosporangiaceae bacterium]|nr:hypothetical protein [Streptosporangiaceae bacterium]
ISPRQLISDPSAQGTGSAGGQPAGSAWPGRYWPRALKARWHGGPFLGTAITRTGCEGYRPASSAGIARDTHAGSSVACADFRGRRAVFLTAADQDASGGAFAKS